MYLIKNLEEVNEINLILNYLDKGSHLTTYFLMDRHSFDFISCSPYIPIFINIRLIRNQNFPSYILEV